MVTKPTSSIFGSSEIFQIFKIVACRWKLSGERSQWESGIREETVVSFTIPLSTALRVCLLFYEWRWSTGLYSQRPYSERVFKNRGEISIPYKFEDYEATEQYIPKRDRVIIRVRTSQRILRTFLSESGLSDNFYHCCSKRTQWLLVLQNSNNLDLRS